MMRITISGGEAADAARIAAALARDGLVVVAGDAPFDLALTLGPALPRRLQAGEVTLDLATRRAARGGVALALTDIEFAILAHLADARRAVDRAELLAAVWGYRFDPGTNLVAVHVCRLRAKLGPGAIAGGRGGYRIAG